MGDKTGFFKTVFLVAAAYDMIIGAVFFFAWAPIFDSLDIAPPGNLSYLHITTAYVFVQGLGYWFVSRNIVRNLDLVRLGIVYKAFYIGIAAYYLAIGQLLHAVFAWFAVFDVIFLVLFVACLRQAAAVQQGQPARV